MSWRCTWYKPSYPVLLALVPPYILVFYLHQLIEGAPPLLMDVGTRSALAPLPRRAPAPPFFPCRSGPAHARRRALELFLRLLCLAPPLLGAFLLRALLSCPAPASGSTQLQPTPLSTLYALVHSHSPSSPSSQHADAGAEVEALCTCLAYLEARVAAQDGALAAYFDDALAPVEKGAGRAALEDFSGGKGETGSRTNTNTVFVPAPPKLPGLLAGWVASLALALARAGGRGRIPSPGRRRASGLEPILEEGEGEPGTSASSSARPAAQPFAYASPAAASALAYAPTPELLLVFLRRCLALAVWPLLVLLGPVRGVLRSAFHLLSPVSLIT
ncbi:hypothetical protein FB451DRAFT_1407894 [Mycena latifolia]|nr:hypothetical protein FB451DRAFT_1407894 [Mycena latifolia]